MIRDMGPKKFLTVDLVDCLRLLSNEDLSQTKWTLTNLECIGRGSSQLEKWQETGVEVLGLDLLHVAAETQQVIDGTFVGRRDNRVWIVIVAWDSYCYDVLTTDPHLLENVRARFWRVTELSMDSYTRWVAEESGAQG
jgi:hypothetical protein